MINRMSICVVSACACAIAYGPAHASVSISGLAHYSWDVVDSNDSTGDSTDDITGNDRESRLTFKGSEDLGSDLSAFWQVMIRTLTNNGTPGLRGTFVGLKGNFGSVLMGRNDSPYKMTTSARVDLFVDRIADYNNIFGHGSFQGHAFDGRQPQVVQYTSPKFSGLQGSVSRASTKINEGAGADEQEEWSGSLTYDIQPLYLALGYETHSGGGAAVGRGTTATSSADAWKVAAQYTFGDSMVGAIYESIDHDAAANVMNRDAWLLNFSHNFGNNTLKLQYAEADDADNTPNTGATNWTIGLDHHFSKRTLVYALYTSMDNESGARYGLRNYSNLGDGAAAQSFDLPPAGVGKNISAFSLGIIHKF